MPENGSMECSLRMFVASCRYRTAKHLSSDHDPLFRFASMEAISGSRDRRIRQSLRPLSHPSLTAIGTVAVRFGPNAFLDIRDLRTNSSNSGITTTVPPPIPHCAANARSGHGRNQAARRPPRLPMAIPLPRPISDTKAA